MEFYRITHNTFSLYLERNIVSEFYHFVDFFLKKKKAAKLSKLACTSVTTLSILFCFPSPKMLCDENNVPYEEGEQINCSFENWERVKKRKVDKYGNCQSSSVFSA